MELFLIKFDFLDHIVVRICIVAMISIHFGDDFGSKKSIKIQFDCDLKQILDGGRLDGMSLECTHEIVLPL